MADIFTPIKIRNTVIKNRIVMAAAERAGLTYDGGLMGEDVIREYETLAENNIGLMYSQSLVISERDRKAVGFPVPGIYKMEHVEPLRRIADAAHRNGSVFIAQLGLAYPYSPRMSTRDLEEIRDMMLYSSKLCIEAGVDGIEIHGAHNVTLNHLISSVTNRRSDKYSDGLNLIREVVQGIRKIAHDDLILSYRMGACFDWDKDIAHAKGIEEMGFDILNVSVGIQEGRAPGIPVDYEYSPMTYAAGLLKEYVNMPVVACWSIDTLARGNKLIEEGKADFAAYGRPFLADPGFVTKGMEDMDHRSCFNCRSCQWYSNGRRCPARLKAERH